MKVLVTGASGFIGSRLIRSLREKQYLVRTFGRKPMPASLSHLEIEHVIGDIRDMEAVSRATAGCGIVFHLAGFVSYRQADIEEQHLVNVAGTANVLQAARMAGVKRVIYTSSLAAMGIPKPCLIGDESIVYNLNGLDLGYCDSKHLAEMEALRYAEQGLPVIILSPGITLGAGDTHPHHRAIVVALSKGWLIGCPGGGVGFSDIDDVVDAHIKAIDSGQVGERYVLVSENLTYRQAAEIVAGLLGVPAPKFQIPNWLVNLAGAACEILFPALGKEPILTKQIAWLSQKSIFFSSQKAVKDLRFHQTPFKETIARTYQFYLGCGEGKTSPMANTRIN